MMPRRKQTVAEIIRSLEFYNPSIDFDPHPVANGSAAARILSALYKTGSADRAVFKEEMGDDVRYYIRRMLGHRLIESDGDRLSITDNGRWHHIAAELGLSMPELCVVAAIYTQMSQIRADPDMMKCTPYCLQNYVFLDVFDLTRNGERKIWSSLYRRGYVRKIGSCKVVMDPGVICRLDPYRPHLVRLHYATTKPMLPARLAAS